MLGWAIMFFVAAVIAGVFGFGGVATTFTGIAVVLFWVFVALLIVSLLFGVVPRGEGVAPGGNGFAFVALVAVIGIFTYAWIKNDWSAERAGAVIDHVASQAAEGTSDALRNIGENANQVARDTSNTIRRDTDRNPDNSSSNNGG
jgi:uncharacterized membrane protein YtjA (UPF0391 family)